MCMYNTCMIWKTHPLYKSIITDNVPANSLIPFTLPKSRYMGIDQRYNETNDDFFDASIYKRHTLLQYLESSNYNDIQKIEFLNHNSFLFNVSIAYTILSGGLYKDFDFEAF